MKMLYIGSRDFLAKSMIEKFRKEDYEVTFLSDHKFEGKVDVAMKHQFYQYSEQQLGLETIIASVKPQIVVFAGLGYIREEWEEDGNYLTVLATVLELSQKYKVDRFIYLSSTQVLEDNKQMLTEESKIAPSTRKGRLMAQGEYLVSLYGKQQGVTCITVRASQLFSNHIDEKGKDWLSSIVTLLLQEESPSQEKDFFYQPLFVEDFTEAIKRVAEYATSDLYQVAAQKPISHRFIKEAVSQWKETNEEVAPLEDWNSTEEDSLISSKKIATELEWFDLYSLQTMLIEKKISYSKKKVKKEKKKHKYTYVSTMARRILENMVIFLFFFLFYGITKEHPLFSQIPWLLVYVTVISISYGVRQSAFSVLLASSAYLYMEELSIFEMVNFYSYAEAALKIVSFVFFGIVISYYTDMLREQSREVSRNHELIKEELEDLKSINRENLVIKEEYEKRILDSKSGITRLYEVVNQLMVLQPERIFVKLMNVMMRMLETDTVAVYRSNQTSPYLRLLHASNSNSVMGGKSWNIGQYKKIQQAMSQGEIYQGNVFEQEPAFIIPINKNDEILAVIVVKQVSFEKQSLYYLNVLRTLRLLIVDSVVRATEYENSNRQLRYVEQSDVLKWEFFLEMYQLAKEKKQENLADFTILKIEGDYTFDLADQLSQTLRVTDYLGIDEENTFYVLLSNSSREDSQYVIQRMKEKAIQARVVTEKEGE